MRFFTAGESHGKGLMAMVEGIPAGLPLSEEYVNVQLARRQKGYGRGGRMAIETDKVNFYTGVRGGQTLGSPLTMLIRNKDWENWEGIMSAGPLTEDTRQVTKARPGHADLAGAIKYRHQDMRNILERASARETAARVAAGSVARRLLEEFGIQVFSHVTTIGKAQAQTAGLELGQIKGSAAESEVACADPNADVLMKQEIDRAKESGDSLGGIFEIIITGLPIGLGSHVHWDRKLDGRLAMALMSIQAIKGVEVGIGFEAARVPGSEVHDELFYDPQKGFYRETNRAGGLEGGMTNGEPLVVRAAMKPIPTLYSPLQSVDLQTKAPFKASVERSDICAVPAAAVVGEAMAALVLAEAMTEKFGSDSLTEMKANYTQYQDYVRQV